MLIDLKFPPIICAENEGNPFDRQTPQIVPNGLLIEFKFSVGSLRIRFFY
jgi:hypothetical protein